MTGPSSGTAREWEIFIYLESIRGSHCHTLPFWKAQHHVIQTVAPQGEEAWSAVHPKCVQ